MQWNKYAVIAGLAFIVAGIVWGINNGFIIIALPTKTTQTHKARETGKKKIATVLAWQHGAWKQEKIAIVTHDQQAIFPLISHWLAFLDDEHIIPHAIALQGAFVSHSGTDLYLSFDHNILETMESTHQKLMLVESLLKTLRENGATIQQVYLQVHHEPLADPHLNFDVPWPIQGFIPGNQ